MSIIKVAFVDTETTGLRAEDGHRLVEVAISCWAYDTVTKLARRLHGRMYIQRINPERSIDPAAEAVHKISLADLRGKPKWKEVAPIVSSILDHIDLFIAHNVAFDAPFLALELMRVGFKCPDMKTFCTMESGRAATPMGKVPNLGELAYATGQEYDSDSAHAADYDVKVMEGAYWKGVEMGLYPNPEEIMT